MPDSGTTGSAPKLKAPWGSVDTHMHFYLPDQYPFVPGPAHKPPEANVAMYRAMTSRIGIDRTVIVQPGGYGTDNRCTLACLAELGERARGVATVGPDISDDELQQMTDAGIRGVRFFMLTGGALGWDVLDRIAARVVEFGWHIHFQMDGRDLPQHEQQIRRWPGQLVVAHTGKFLEPVTVDDPAFKVLLNLVERGNTWVKLSAPYETSKVGPPHYDDVADLARALVATAPDRMLWASNWPHPGEPVDAKPDEAMLLDTLLDWVPDEATRNRILVDNPVSLYRF